MANTSVLADTLTRIRNAQRAMHMFVVVRSSNMVKASLAVLKKEGYVKDFAEFEERPGVKSIKIDLKYYRDAPVISELKMISKPGCRVHSSVKRLGKSHGGLGIVVVSTSAGILSDDEARANNIGGEVLFSVF